MVATGASLTAFTMVLSTPPRPSVTSYLKVSTPLKSSSGLYAKAPLPLRMAIPFAGLLDSVVDSTSRGSSVSFARTPGANKVSETSSEIV